MSAIDSNAIQIGQSGTPANNFVVATDGAGGLKISRGNLGATTQDILSVNAAGTISPIQATTAGAPTYSKGAMYFDTTLNKLRIGGATAWETITSA